MGSVAGGSCSKSKGSKQPEAPWIVTAGLGQGQGETPGWSLLLEFPWSESSSKANLVSVIGDNRKQQKNTKGLQLAANQWVCTAPGMRGSRALRKKEMSNNSVYFLLITSGSQSSDGKLCSKLKVSTKMFSLLIKSHR